MRDSYKAPMEAADIPQIVAYLDSLSARLPKAGPARSGAPGANG